LLRKRLAISEGTVDQVKYIRDIYARFTVLIHEIAKFGIVGGIGFVVQLGVQNAMHYTMGVGPSISLVIGYIAATAFTFAGNRYWAFKHRQGKGLRHESALFIILNCVGIGIQLAVVDAATYGLGLKDPLSYNLSTVIGIGLGTLFRLWSYRRWVFLAVPPSAEAEERQPEPSVG
jgi:putative flippase GtrA